MARSIYARAASRGFPVVDFGGQTGEGHTTSYGGGMLSWQSHAQDGSDTRGWDNATGQSSRVFGTAAEISDVGIEWINEAPLYGLPGGIRPAQLPHAQTADAPPAGPRTPAAGQYNFDQYRGGIEGPTHAAPMPNLPLNKDQQIEYFSEESEVHGGNFGGHEARADQARGLKDMPGWSHEPENDGGSTSLQPVQGYMRVLGGLDSAQGYGGGGPGPGGTNEARQYGYWRDESRQAVDISPVIVSAGEVPFITELPQMFTATDPTTIGQPLDYGYVATGVNKTPQAPYDPPPVSPGAPLPAGDPTWAFAAGGFF